MYKRNIKELFKDVIKEAQAIKIPVPENIIGEIYINPRPKKRFGCCRKTKSGYEIELSQFVLDAPEKKIKEILAHELLHTCMGCQDHGSIWKKFAGMMNEAYGYNIKRVNSFEEMGLAQEIQDKDSGKIRYIIKCQNCGREYPRQRFTCVMKKINAYRCQCGGKLTVIEKTKY